jgi:hypothetical protein
MDDKLKLTAISINFLLTMNGMADFENYCLAIVKKSTKDAPEDSVCDLCGSSDDDDFEHPLLPQFDETNDMVQTLTCGHIFHSRCLYKQITRTDIEVMCPIENCNKQIFCNCGSLPKYHRNILRYSGDK